VIAIKCSDQPYYQGLCPIKKCFPLSSLIPFPLLSSLKGLESVVQIGGQTMNNLKTTFLAGLALLLTTTSISVSAQDVASRIEAALAHPDRDPADSVRDESRKPVEVISFIGIESGMTVLDVASSSGWYAEVLAAAVGPNGKVIAQNSSRFAERIAEPQALKIARHPNIMPIVAENAEGFGIDGQADAAWTALNLHDNANRGTEAGLEFLGAIYDAMKPGAVLAVIDHEGSPGMDNAALHRIDVNSAIAIVEAAGFVVEAQAYMLNNPADDHTLHMRELERNSDRFVLRARKPAM
jgi:predicted methyltransferase